MLPNFVDNQENFSHQAVFGDLDNSQFTVAEAAEYLEISDAIFSQYLKSQMITADTEIGSEHLYSLKCLRKFKDILNLTLRHD